jgi:hypothetical protein
MTLHEQKPLVGEDNTVRALINNIVLVGTIHVVEAKQAKINVL